MPYLLRRQGVAVDRIADIVALALVPSVWYFIYSPLVDMGLRRRTWVLIAAASTALCSALAVILLPVSLPWVTVLLVSASACAGLLSSSCGALMTMLAPGVRGRASGWYQTGNLGGGAIGGGVAIWLADRISLPGLALGVAILLVAPALTALLIRESPVKHAGLLSHTAALFRDLGTVLRSRRTFIGLLFFVSPVGAAAVVNLIAGLGPDYRAPAAEVMWVSGFAGGLLSAVGSLAGGWIADRMNRMFAYVLGGGFAALFGLYLAFGGKTGLTYGAGYSAYAIGAGFSYAVFTALVLEVLGDRPHAAGTSYSFLVALGNLPVTYMTWLDGVGYKHWGVKGLMGMDALTNAGGAVLLLFVALRARRFWTKTFSGVVDTHISF